MRKFVVSAEQAGQRVDKFLAAVMPEFSRAEIQRMEKNFDNSRKVKEGDVVRCTIDDIQRVIENKPILTSCEEDLPFQIIYEDDDVIAVDKPRGMVMYPAVGNVEGTLVQYLAAYCPLSALGGDVRPGVVHRIDKDTSGVVILAKSDAAFRALTKVFSDHELIRKYIAFVWGIPPWVDADIEGNISRSSRNRQKMSMVKAGGKEAKTSVHVQEVWPRAGISEFLCTLFTGRTHQIRVHLSAHGFGVLTDPLYGRGKEDKIKPSELLEFLREHQGQCLHAEILELVHPITGEPLKLRAPLPEDLVYLKECLDSY